MIIKPSSKELLIKSMEWDKYFIDIAKAVASRSACDRLSAGCVLVRDKRIFATGYNASLSGLPTCNEVGHLMVEGHCVRTAHAEDNAIAQAAGFGIATMGASAYITHTPCFKCLKLLISCGIKEIVYEDGYRRDENTFAFAKDSGVTLRARGSWLETHK
jgi:dCMP deaminase